MILDVEAVSTIDGKVLVVYNEPVEYFDVDDEWVDGLVNVECPIVYYTVLGT